MRKEAAKVGTTSLNREITKSERGVMRNSTGKIVGNTPLSTSKGKALPHYLHASAGSCHDFCKYGKKHTFDEKQSYNILSKFSLSKRTPGKEKVSDKKLITVKKKSMNDVKIVEASSNSRTIIFNESGILAEEALTTTEFSEFVDSIELISRDHSSHNIVKLSGEIDIIKINSACQPDEFDKSSQNINQTLLGIQEAVLNESFKIVKQEHEPSSLAKNVCLPKDVETTEALLVEKFQLMEEPEGINFKQSVQNTSSSMKHRVKSQASSVVKETISGGRPKAHVQRTSLSESFDTCAKSGRVLRLAAPSPKPTTQMIKKAVQALKSTPPTRSSMTITSHMSRKINCNSVVIQPAGISKTEQKKQLRTPRTLLHVPLASKHSSSRVDCGKVNKNFPTVKEKLSRRIEPDIGNIEEKTIYVVEPNGQPLLLLPSAASSSSSSLTNVEVEELNELKPGYKDESDLALKNGLVYMKDHRKMKAKEKVTTHTPEKEPSTKRLKFRSGKVVHPQSESNGAQRLRFRQGRVLAENYHEVVQRRNFRRKEISLSDGNKSHLENQTVVLRHQDVHGKKDEQVLLNDVIKETATKLVETRKSKVKALVGAFETVISLHESKTGKLCPSC